MIPCAIASAIIRVFYSWPGNVRELEHAIHRAIVLARASSSRGDIILQPQHFTFDNTNHSSSVIPKDMPVPIIKNLRDATEDFQRKIITQSLEQNHFNWSASARELEIDTANLHRLAKRLILK
ncbi:transcriptional regulator [Providencia sp.]|uniref:transcriptional regulator n=1 Tax=Providencia sp. TaxID=589 RepID=UPI003F95C7AE